MATIEWQANKIIFGLQIMSSYHKDLDIKFKEKQMIVDVTIHRHNDTEMLIDIGWEYDKDYKVWFINETK